MKVKFKAWNKNTEEWIDPDNVSINGNGNISYNGITMDCVDIFFSCGIKDKSGNEIFEGDIIKATDEDSLFMGIVYFQFGTFCLKNIKQSESAINHGYADCIRLWDDGINDHYSLELIVGQYEIEVLGNEVEKQRNASNKIQ